MYFLNYVDRNTLAQARLNGLEDELGMHGSQFNTTISILFVGYILTQVPSNMLITRVAPSIYMSAWMVIWAAVSGEKVLIYSWCQPCITVHLLMVVNSLHRVGAIIRRNGGLPFSARHH